MELYVVVPAGETSRAQELARASGGTVWAPTELASALRDPNRPAELDSLAEALWGS